MDVAAVRAELPALAKTTYLNTAGIGPSPRVVTDTMVRLYRQIESDSPDPMAFGREEFTQAEATRARVAAHWRVEADEVALLRSTAEGFMLRANRGPDGVTGVRICCAFFNTEEEVARVGAAVRAIAATRVSVGAAR